jgi:glycosyltransferase involved in cell wall biosynthesis
MHVLQVSCYSDPLNRSPEELLVAWQALGGVAGAVAQQGVQVTVLQPAGRDAVLQREGAEFHFVRERQGTGVRRALGLWASPRRRNVVRRARQLRPDIVHFQGLSFPLHVRQLQRSLPGVPFLVQDHADPLHASWRRPLYRWGLAKVNGVAFTARAQARRFVDAGILRSGMPIFEVLESSSRFTPGDRDGARAETGVYGDPCFLWVGRLDDNKDPLTVIEALHTVMPQLPDPHCWFCYTDAPRLAAVRECLASEPELAARVHLLGEVPHATVELMCRAADFLVLGSHREGSGYAVVEALACGTIPLVTDIPSFREITADGRIGGLSPPGDADAMARNILEWSSRDNQQLRRAARAHFERALSFDAVGAQLRDAYESVLRES